MSQKDKFYLDRCLELARDGQFSKACQMLISRGIASSSAANIAAMREKHPSSMGEIDLSSMDPTPNRIAPEITSETVEKTIRSFRRGTAPGRTALRAQHLLDGLRSAHNDEILVHLTKLVNLLASGNAPQQIAPYLAGASLIGLFKDDNSLRPVAVGEVLRRLVAKCLCDSTKDDAKDLLQPMQIGVALPSGCEIGIHTVRQWWERNAGREDKFIFLADFANAFNTVDRKTFLQAVRRSLPVLSAWTEWCYGQSSHLFFDGARISSECGVQQGDPLGPLLFSLTLFTAYPAKTGGREGRV